MPWTADLIYTKPNPDLIKHLGGIEGFADELFLVDDLEGIRFESTREFMLSDQETEKSHMKHGLPESGLLAIKPNVSATGYDTDFEMDSFWDIYKDAPADKWGFMESLPYEQLELEIDLQGNQRKLLGLLKSLSMEFNTPILYYFCFMWGGYTEEEYAVVFDKGMRVYAYDREKEKDVEIIGGAREELSSTLLQTSLKHLDLDLPTWFFALHESSFDWKRYHLKKDAS
jgi:hypothetical protein